MKKKVRKTLPFLIALTFILISLGGATRAMHAGLSCPDWPLCFGDVIPDVQIQVYYEFIHRAVAGVVALFFFGISYFVLKGKEFTSESKWAVGVGIVFLLIQIVLGGLTVLKLLDSKIVTSHLGFGVGFFACLLWIYYSLGTKSESTVEHKPPWGFLVALVTLCLIIYIQIILGGLVSTNYAGVACADFPLCGGEFIPTFSGLIGLQVIHRLGAYVVAISIISFYLFVSQRRNAKWMDKRYFNLAGSLLIAILIQIGVGAANVLFKIPPVITVVHLAVATVLLGIALHMLFLARHHVRRK